MPGAVIFMHGLGDQGQSWSYIRRELGAKLPEVKWQFPNAPDAPVTVNGGFKMPSWWVPDDDGRPAVIRGIVYTPVRT